jgi:hypothetical protein
MKLAFNLDFEALEEVGSIAVVPKNNRKRSILPVDKARVC